jgi:hypothetical protein
MNKKQLGILALIALFCTLLFLSIGIGIASAQQDVLRLDVDKSYVINLDTGGTKTFYREFLNTEQLEGHTLEFHIYVDKVEKAPILDEYVLKLETNLEGPPEWKFGVEPAHRSAEWIVWKGKEEHEPPLGQIILTGEVPKPIIPVEEPGFEAYKETKGIGRREVYVKLTVGTTRDGATLETIIQPLEPAMTFSSTTEKIQDAQSEIAQNLDEARGKIGSTDLEEDIRRLAEEGHPGWASQLSAHYKALSVQAEPPPLTLYVLLAVLLGLIIGATFVYVYVSRGGGKGVDVSQISTELQDTSGRLEEKSSSLTAISTKFARSEDDEKRSVARDLLKLRASLNELSTEIRTIADRLKGVR